ncbi:mitogen-activated protein kinase-binding protein 1 [Plakobranchus ocellatus]|uniref:Mitogen-activated protein kinase-binding protein 1 n=1 Tax=Plakobranchus ocellatus TaxID=259542 RepID=A0AAV3Y936_9GAST|nr:mitogen-activated protein kinase-binding protein 1 [Plakobranchus ocellatus]
MAKSQLTNRRADPAVQPLYGRLGLLGECKEHTFIDVVCGTGASADSVFAITRAGGLVIVSAKTRKIKGHKNIVGVKGTCIKAHDRVLFIGFNNGDIHMFNSTTLLHLGALPLPTFFRRSGLNSGGVFTLTFNLSTLYLTTAYKNSSMCVWDMQDTGNVKQRYVAVYHSEAITNFDLYSSREPQDQAIRETLVTVSQDSTVRLWGVLFDNMVCFDNLSILNFDNGTLGRERLRHGTLENSGVITAIKISPDQKYIVTGNKVGTICVYDKGSYKHFFTVKAHNREVTCLTFYNNTALGHLALVSGGRDRTIQVIDASCDFRLVSSLYIHSSSITALKVCQREGKVYIVCSASDRSISLSEASQKDSHRLTLSPPTTSSIAAKKLPSFQLTQSTTCVSSPTDMAVDHRTQDLVIGFQDGNIRIMELTQLKEKRMFPGCTSGEAQINKVALDSCSALLLTAASDKTINVINYLTGQNLHTVTGHNKCVTGLVFTSNGDHMISASMDGCIFLWRLSPYLLAKRKEIYLRANSTTSVHEIVSCPLTPPKPHTRVEHKVPMRVAVKAHSFTLALNRGCQRCKGDTHKVAQHFFKTSSALTCPKRNCEPPGTPFKKMGEGDATGAPASQKPCQTEAADFERCSGGHRSTGRDESSKYLSRSNRSASQTSSRRVEYVGRREKTSELKNGLSKVLQARRVNDRERVSAGQEKTGLRSLLCRECDYREN